jgi:hypothetical protein
MTNTEKALAHITEQVKKYRSTGVEDGNELISILQQMTATLYFLETERAIVHNRYQVKINDLMADGCSFNKAEIQANVEIPQMYQYRRVMDASYKVVDAIRTQVSWLKSEKSLG